MSQRFDRPSQVFMVALWSRKVEWRILSYRLASPGDPDPRCLNSGVFEAEGDEDVVALAFEVVFGDRSP